MPIKKVNKKARRESFETEVSDLEFETKIAAVAESDIFNDVVTGIANDVLAYMETQAFKELLDNDGRFYKPIPHLVEGKHRPIVGADWELSDMDW